MKRALIVVALIFIASLGGPLQAAGSDLIDPMTPDATMPTDALALALVPLSKDQLGEVAGAWFELVQQEATALSDGEIAVTQLEAGQGKAEQIEKNASLREARTAALDRFKIVLSAYETKGGDVADYEKYVAAVSGVHLDAGDLSATSATILAWLKSKEGGIRWGTNIGLFLGTLLVSWVLAGIVSRIVRRAIMRTSAPSELLKDFLCRMSKGAVFLIGFAIALSMLEVPIGPLVAGLGAAGFIIGFAVQGTLSNFASGIMILLYRPFDLDDFVQIGGVSGSVRTMTLVSTTITTPDNQIVVVPNNKIWGDVITNVTGSDTRRIDLVFGIGYEDDIDRATQILTEVVTGHPKVLDDPAPVVRVSELADSSVNFVVRPWSKTSDYWDVRWDVIRDVKKRFDDEGISIPFPQQDIHIQHVPA